MTVRVAAVLVALAATSAYSQEPQPQPTSRNARELLNVVPDLLVETQMKLISSSVASIQEAAWVPRAPTGFCRDCVFTTVVLKRREGDGVRTYIASWDDSQSATPELRELRRLALELQSARSGR